MKEPRGPALDRVITIARELGDLAHQVVFIGGAIAPLLQTDPPFPRARPTSDVDAVVGTTTYTASHHFQQELRRRHFRQPPDAPHAHRWVGPSGIPFDLVPAGEHLGGSGNPWDAIAIATALEITLEGNVRLRYASAPAFLAQKWAAHHDRGRDDPLLSSDLEDILALLASRPTIAEEVADAPHKLRAYLGQQARSFLDDPLAEDLLAAHLSNAQDPAATISTVREHLRLLGQGA